MDIKKCYYCDKEIGFAEGFQYENGILCLKCYSNIPLRNLKEKISKEKIAECNFCKKDIFKGEHFSEVLVDDYGNKFVYFTCCDCLKKKTYNATYGIKEREIRCEQCNLHINKPCLYTSINGKDYHFCNEAHLDEWLLKTAREEDTRTPDEIEDALKRARLGLI